MSADSVSLLVAAILGLIVGAAGLGVLCAGEDPDEPWFMRLDSRLGAAIATIGGFGVAVVSVVSLLPRI